MWLFMDQELATITKVSVASIRSVQGPGKMGREVNAPDQALQHQSHSSKYRLWLPTNLIVKVLLLSGCFHLSEGTSSFTDGAAAATTLASSGSRLSGIHSVITFPNLKNSIGFVQNLLTLNKETNLFLGCSLWIGSGKFLIGFNETWILGSNLGFLLSRYFHGIRTYMGKMTGLC